MSTGRKSATTPLMSRRRLRLGAGSGSARPAVALFAAVTLLTLVIASASAAPASDAPSLPGMAIAGTDLSRGAISRQGYRRETGFVLYYQRVFRRGAAYRRSRFLELEADVGLAGNARTASTYVNGLESAFKSKRLRALLVRQILAGAPRGMKGLAKVTFGRVGKVGIGNQAFIAPISISIGGLVRLQFAIAAVRVDRVDQTLFLVGMPGANLARADVAALLRLAAGHMTTGLTPTVVTPPTITGTPQSGQTLTATRGLWTNAPRSYGYQWLRCDGTGANCQPIADAVTSTYLVTDTDIGSTLRVDVTATDAVATSVAAQSDATTIITGAPPAAPGAQTSSPARR